MSVNYPDHRPTGSMLNEADTCRKYIVPRLQASGWDNDPHSITEQRCFTDGDVRDLKIPTPPLAEQHRIVAELDALKRLQAETAGRQALHAPLDALLPALLDRAFKGEL